MRRRVHTVTLLIMALLFQTTAAAAMLCPSEYKAPEQRAIALVTDQETAPCHASVRAKAESRAQAQAVDDADSSCCGAGMLAKGCASAGCVPPLFATSFFPTTPGDFASPPEAAGSQPLPPPPVTSFLRPPIA